MIDQAYLTPLLYGKGRCYAILLQEKLHYPHPMSEESTPAENPPGQDLPAGPDVPGEISPAGFSRRKKMLIILAMAVLAGIAVGVGGAMLISWAKSKPPEIPAAAAPQPDLRQQALIEELKAKNVALENRLKEPAAPPAPQDAPTLPTAPSEESEALKTLREKNEKLEAQLTKAQEKAARLAERQGKRGKGKPEKVTEDCTVPDGENKLGDKLKDCIEGFNSATH
jgi:hypothetical protein